MWIIYLLVPCTLGIRVPSSWTESKLHEPIVQTSELRPLTVPTPRNRSPLGVIKPVYEPEGTGIFVYPSGSHADFVAYNRRNFEVKRTRQPDVNEKKLVKSPLNTPQRFNYLKITQKPFIQRRLPEESYRGPTLLQRAFLRKQDNPPSHPRGLSGVWAVPGIKYRPQIIQRKPPPKHIKPIVEEHEDSEEDFVPTRMLTQVRKNEEETHEPFDENLRLRKVVKDTKIHTVYTEDGYEDTGYDHGNYEKNKEKSESFKHRVNVSVNVKPIVNITGENNHVDADFSESTYPTNQQKYNLINNTTEVKNLKLGQMEVEYKSEIKLVTTPNNITRAYKYIKIAPKYNETRSKRSIEDKYPYYHINVTNLNRNSPLRYSENLNNIPRKPDHKMSFYQSIASSQCPEIIENFDKIEKVNGESDERKSNPRLKDLGDKIDCLKTKYFGLDPLDSPIFHEEITDDDSIVKEIDNESNSMRNRILQDMKEFNSSASENQPESSPLRLILRKRQRKRPKKRPTKLRQRTTPKPKSKRFPTRKLPKEEILSEVHYKDDIKPNEQLNVFTDVLNIIKSSTPESSTETIAITDQPLQHKNHKQAEEFYADGSRHYQIKSPSRNFKRRPIPISFKTTPSPKKLNYGSNYLPRFQTPSRNYRENQKNLPLYPPLNNKDVDKEKMESSAIVNYFLVPGMKPPAQKSPQRRQLYRFRRNYHRNKRSPYKPSYSEIRRGGATPPPPPEEVDDYIPQRNRNYYYDPNLRKIVYTNPKTEEEEEIPQEDEAEESEEVTEPPTPITIRPVWTTPPGPSFLHFIDNLKMADGYKIITDPTKPPSTTPVLKETTTTPKGPTEVPQFLSILARVKNDETYKPIAKTKPTTTTTTTENYEEVEEVQTFDITELMPKPSVKTTIDYSKYKTIERNPIPRYNLSSRYNGDEDELPHVDTTQVPVLGKLEERHDVVTESTTISTRRRARPKTRRPTTTSTTTTKRPERTTSNLFKRRRPATRPKLSTTTEVVLKAESSYTQKVIRRRLQVRGTPKNKPPIPSNHKAVYVPVTLPEQKMATPTAFTSRPFVRKSNLIKTEVPRRSQSRKLGDVEIIHKYDQDKKHGGNYRRAEETMRLVDIVPKPFAFYSDPKLPEYVNQLKETDEDEPMLEQIQNKDYDDYEDQVRINFNKNDDNKVVFIVRDPSKRLYYYAPVK